MSLEDRSARPWVAALLGLLSSGLGLLYAGRPALALAVLGATLGLAGLATLSANALGFGAGAAAALAVAVLWVGQAAWAARIARTVAGSPRRRSSRWPALVGFYAASTLASNTLFSLLHRAGEGFYVSASSMAPTLIRGDVVWVAKEAPADLRGAVVLVAPPAGSAIRDPLLKRVAAIEGEVVEVRDGELWVNGVSIATGPCSAPAAPIADGSGAEFVPSRCRVERAASGRVWTTLCFGRGACGDITPLRVPAGHVYLLGDARDHSADSRYFGPVPATSILGEPRFVYLSLARGVPSFERLGLTVR